MSSYINNSKKPGKSLREKIVTLFDDAEAHSNENIRQNLERLKSTPIAAPTDGGSLNPLDAIFCSRNNH